MRSKAKTGYGVLIWSIIALSGCVTVANLDLSYYPTRESPLMDIKQMNFALAVEDHRNSKQRYQLGDNVISKKDILTILYDAIGKELKFNGHKVVDIKEDSDVVINVHLKKYWIHTKNKMISSDKEIVGILSSNIRIINPRNHSILFSKTINSTTRDNRETITESVYERVLNKALAEFIRCFSRDTGLLRALEDFQLHHVA